MPSASKKKKKNANNSEDTLLSPTAQPCSSPHTTPLKEPELNEDERLLRCLEEAAVTFPSLIGTSAFVGRVIDSESQSKGCSGVWLSHPSMLEYSLLPHTTVAVSLASSTSPNGFALSSLVDEYAKNLGISCSSRLLNYAGNYFALATLFSSCKVLKGEVRLSSDLLYSLGCPAPGRIAFVYPIQSQSATEVNGKDKLIRSSLSNISLPFCKELHLELVSSSVGNAEGSNNILGTRAHGRYENGEISSPSTPLHSHSKLGILNSSIHEEVISSSTSSGRTSLDSFDVVEVLEDESAKKLLESCAPFWLFSRRLLCGNFVTVPSLSKIYVFQVLSGIGISTGRSTKSDLAVNINGNVFPQDPDKFGQVDCAFTVNNATKVYIFSSSKSALETPLSMSLPCVDYESKDIKASGGVDVLKLGGLSKEYAILRGIIDSSALRDTLSCVGLQPIKGVLLHGPPGTGKTSLIRKCVQDTGVNLFTVNGPEVVSQYYGESEQALHKIFDSASRAKPAVVFIDELDAIAPERKEGGEELSLRMVATLLDLMNEISSTDGLLVVAATNRPESIEPALRRPGRLDREIEIGVPSPNERHDILLALLSEIEHDLLDIEIQQLAMATHGFVGADLAAVCNEAALVCLRRHVNFKKSCDKLDLNQACPLFDGCCSSTQSSCSKDSKDIYVPNTQTSSPLITNFSLASEVPHEESINENGVSACGNILKVAFDDFEKARMKVRPSAMREVILEVPKVKWEDVGGQKEVKMQLMEAVEWPQKHQDCFQRIGTRPPSGVLLFGPPGCSKTLLARAVASEARLNFLAVKGPELFSKWVGESEKAVKSLFAKARANAPSIIFFDEIDGLAVVRGKESDGVSVADRVISQLLVELDGLQQRANVTVIAATNRPDNIDPALLRPGRFDRLLFVGPPNVMDREDIFRIHLQKIPCSLDVCIKQLALLTEGYTGADISLICREAALAAIEESLDALEVRMDHLETAVAQVRPSEKGSYEELSVNYQRLVQSRATEDGKGDQPGSTRLLNNHFWTRWIYARRKS